VADRLTDADLPRVYADLGLPGVADIHVHFMPDQVLRKVWAYFDAAPGGRWEVRYRLDETERLRILGELGVLAHTALLYPHKPGMAAWLNDWGVDFAARTPNCVATGTFFPESDVDSYVDRALRRGIRVFKVHLQVGAYDPRDPMLERVWGMLADARTPVVCHCASSPAPGPYTGPGPIGAVMDRHPDLTLVIAHCGSPEYVEFLDLAQRYPNVHLDTTMTFTDFTNERSPFPAAELPRLRDLADRVVLGSDFPNIPYPYAHQIEALIRLDLGDDWLRRVLHDNGMRLLGRAQ
jgi:uncharacterized protein